MIIDSARKVPTLAGKVQSSGVVSAGEAIVSFTKEGGGSGNGGGGNIGDNVNNVVSSGGNNIDIDYMRSNAPNGAEPHVSANELPNYVYDDPQPTNTQWFDAYYNDIGNLNNSVGYAGVMPGEIGDPTTSGAVGGIQTVDLGSQNINFAAPVVSLSGRAGLNLNLSINYNSKSVWGESNNTWAAGGLSSPVPFNSDKGFPGPGWRTGFGVIQGIYLTEFSRLAPYLNGGASGFFIPSYLFIGPDGKRHNLFETFPNTNVYKSVDNTNMIFDGGSRILRLADGAQITFGQLVIRDGQLLPTQVKDRNGNIITIVNATVSNGNGAASNGDIAIDYVIDTLGRTIDFYYESNRLRKIRQNRDGAWYDYAVIDYAPVTMSVNFVGVTLDPGAIVGNVVWLPSRVDYPTGENYRFYYTSYAQMYLVEKWVPAVSAQGAERRVGYTRYNLPSYNGQSYPANPLVTADAGAQNRCPTFTQRKEWAENWNDDNEASYNYEFAADGSYSKLTDPTVRVYRTDFHSTENIFKVFSSESSYNNGNGVFGWNSAGGVTGVGTNIIGAEPNATSNVVGGLQYRGFGGVRGMNFGANPRKMEVSWDLRRQQMTRMKVMRTDNTDPIVDQEYDYYTGPNGQNNGRIQRVTDYLDAAYSATYNYDDINRLSAITAGAYSRAYTFDEWGNLRALAANGGGETGSYTLNYASNASGAPATNRISGHGYDAAGNLTNDGSIYAYDAGSRLKSVNGTSVTYDYDGDGRRVKNQVSPCGPIYYYLWSSALGQVMAEINGGDGSVYRAYVYSPGGQMLAEQSYDGQFYWIHKDHLGSGRKLTNSSGTVVYRGEFDPHGQAILEVGEETYLNSRKFAGYERDWATNLDNANARIFSHNRGRFIQPDPLGFLSIDPAKPQSLNAYSYVYNDPANFVDPTGEIAIGVAIILAAGLVGGAVEAYNCHGCSGMQRLKAFGIGFAAGAVGGAAAVLGAATGSLLGVAVFGGIGGAASTLVGNGLKNGGLSKSDVVPAVTAGAVGFVLAGGAQAIMNKVLPASGYFSQTNLIARNLGSNYMTTRWQMYQVNVWNLMHARGWMSRPAETFNNVGANTLAALTQPIIQPKIDSVVSSSLANIQVDLGMLPGVDGGYGASLGPWDSSRLFKPGGAFYFPTLIDCGLGCITVYPDRQIWNGGSLTPTGGNTRPRR